MADIFDKQKRSKIMGLIRGRNTKPEILVRKFLFANGLRFRLHNKNLAGSPDIVLKKFNTVVFINGCFWHGHQDCSIFKMPKTNKKFWNAKIQRNKERDKRTIDQLEAEGWNVLTVWECQLKTKVRLETLEKLIDNILNKY